MNLNEVAPPGWGHTKAEKEKTKPDKPKSKIGGSAAAFDRARKEGRFKGSKEDMFKLMWWMKNKGGKPKGKPHYKPGTDEKYKKYQDKDETNESVMPNVKSKDKAAIKARYKGLFKKDLKGNVAGVNEASAVLDSNKQIQKKEQRKKDEKEYVRLYKQLQHMKKLKELGLESFDHEIKPKDHRKAQREKKIRDRTKTGDEGSKIAQTKVKGPKLYGEEDNFSQKDKELKRTKSARNQRYSTLHSGTNTSKNTDVNEELTFEGWKERAVSAVKKVVKKKEEKKPEPPTGTEKKLRDWRKSSRKRDHETVNFLDPDD